MASDPLGVGSISLRLYPHDSRPADQIAEMRAQAALAASVGFDGVMVSEHHANFPGYLPNPVQLAGFLLDAMASGWAAPCPLLLPTKPYGLIAEDIAWMAQAYPGRVGAGFAAGALQVDFDVAEVPFAEATDRFKAALPKVVAALRGDDPTPLGDDRALRACNNDPIPMVVAAQSEAAVRRAATYDLGVLFDSLQTNEVSRRLAVAYHDAGGLGSTILIRRVWIGDPPEQEMAAQMDRYRSYTGEQKQKNWGDSATDQLVTGADGAEVAEALHTVLEESACDTVNLRVHAAGIEPAAVREQIERLGTEMVPRLRELLSG